MIALSLSIRLLFFIAPMQQGDRQRGWDEVDRFIFMLPLSLSLLFGARFALRLVVAEGWWAAPCSRAPAIRENDNVIDGGAARQEQKDGIGLLTPLAFCRRFENAPEFFKGGALRVGLRVGLRVCSSARRGALAPPVVSLSRHACTPTLTLSGRTRPLFCRASVAMDRFRQTLE